MKNKEKILSIIVIAVIICIASGYFLFFNDKNRFPIYSITSDNTFSTNIDGYFESCMENSIIYKKLNDNWIKVSNDLPDKGNYYLDEEYFGYGMCDLVVCNKLPEPHTLKLIEYKKTGEKAPPLNSGTTAKTLPVYQTFPLNGDLKINIEYFNDKNCQNMETFSAIIKK